MFARTSGFAPLVPASLLLLVGCSDMFDPSYLILDLRVLGVSAEVEGDPSRSRPQPGEDVRFRVAAFAPEANPAMTWTMGACLSEGTAFGGLAPCTGGFLGVSSQRSPSAEPPVLSVTVPEGASARQIQLVGVLCASGTPRVSLESLDPAALGTDLCEGPDSPGEPFFFRTELDFDSPNRSPRFSADAFSLGGVEWPPSSAGPCTPGDGRPRVAMGEDVEIAIGGFSDDDREAFIFDRGGPSGSFVEREALLFSSFTTSGELERQFSRISEDGDTRVEFDWTPPDDEERALRGDLVRFFFALRDGRGGFDWQTRELCLGTPRP